MPNIRIKDIPTTASATSSTDFIAIDGATNGTRKLSADSPVFSGNVTVNGTGRSSFAGQIKSTGGGDPASGVTGAELSVSGGAPRISFTKSDAAVDSKVADIVFLGGSAQIRFRNDAATSSRSAYAVTGSVSSVTAHTFYTGVDVASATINSSGNLLIGGTTDITGSGGLKVFGTTASTSTTTGALQVAGGVGVAGALYAGGGLYGTGQVEAIAADSFLALRAGSTLQGYLRGFSASSEIYLYNVLNGPLFLGTNTATRITISGSGGVTFGTASPLTLNATTASTSTTTGALQVAGGVGVAGALFVGGNIVSTGAGTHYLAADATSAGSATLYLKSTSGASYIGFNESFNIGTIASVGGAVTSVLSLTSTGNLTTGGSISTSAPTGGAGAWELGVANTVTPTAPNRTITIEIGGTVFYLHAKTTND